MNQTKKRLAIIELAISINDTEAVSLQLLKLQPLKSDNEIHDILTLLDEQNYAQAQALIATYIEKPTKTIIQRIPEEEPESSSAFSFGDAKIEIPEPESRPISRETEEREHLDTLLNINPSDVMSDNIKINISAPAQEEYIKEKIDFNLHTVPKDSFFDNIKKEEDTKQEIEQDIEQDIEDERVEDIKQESKEEIVEDTEVYYTPQIEEVEPHVSFENRETQIKFVDDSNIERPYAIEEDFAPIPEEPVPYEEPTVIYEEAEEEVEEIEEVAQTEIRNIYENLQKLEEIYPLVDQDTKLYSSELKEWLETIDKKTYTEFDVEEILKHIEILSKEDKAEAAQFLLATSTTESKYAQFILARALYRGTLLQRNLEESFGIMSRLAFKDKYPEAICDLAQFYENGICVESNKVEAQELYHKAMELNVQRAENHYNRLKEENKGLFSFFKK